MKTLNLIIGILVMLGLAPTLAAQAIPVEVVETDAGYQLLRGGEPYEIRGAGLEYSDISVFAAHGGNSIRTWRTGDEKFSGMELLDEAHANGVSVALCIEIGRERQGFDYNDEAAVAAQLEYARQEVLKYKDHPALLVWIVGNEPNLFYENPRVFDAVNDISKMIHEVDGKHPTTTALAGFNADLAEQMRTRSPDLDFVSIQMYGDVVNLPRYIEELGWTDPYMVTEWGAIGHWEVRSTEWGAPVEQDSTAKADNYRKSHEIAIAAQPQQVIGSYVFLWGQKQERTPTWYGMFLPDGSETEPVDVMHHIWKGEWPDNRSPQVTGMRLDDRSSAEDIVLQTGSSVSASVKTNDPDGDEVQYQWVLMQESQATQHGGDLEAVPEEVTGLIKGGDTSSVSLSVPQQAGAYRLFVYARDGRGKAGHANIPFKVE